MNKEKEMHHKITTDGKVYTFLKAEFMLDELEMQQIEELTKAFQQYKSEDGKRPFVDWTEEKVFQTIMETGSKWTLIHHIKNAQFAYKMISAEQLIDKDFQRIPYTPYSQEEVKKEEKEDY